MRIGLIGGLDRNAPLYERMASAQGHELMLHTGHLGGRGVKSLERLLEHSDLVVYVTEVNGHGALEVTRRLLRERGRTPLLIRKCGSSRFAQLLDAISTSAATGQQLQFSA